MRHLKQMALSMFMTCSPTGVAVVLLAQSAMVTWAVDASVQRGSNGPVWFEGARLIVGDGSAPIENSAFVVEGDGFTWVGKRGQRQPPPGAVRVDLSGKTVMPALIDGHNHIGLVNQLDGSNSKANYTRDNLTDQLERYAYYGVSAALSMGLDADQELAYEMRDAVIPNAARFLRGRLKITWIERVEVSQRARLAI